MGVERELVSSWPSLVETKEVNPAPTGRPETGGRYHVAAPPADTCSTSTPHHREEQERAIKAPSFVNKRSGNMSLISREGRD